MAIKDAIKGTIKPCKGKVFVELLESGQRKSKGGIILRDDNGKDHGIRPRWAKVYAVGEDVDDLFIGDWVLLEHGRWTFGMDIETTTGVDKVWVIDYPSGVIVVSDTQPDDYLPNE